MVYSALGGGFHLVSLLSLSERTGGLFLGVNFVGEGNRVEIAI